VIDHWVYAQVKDVCATPGDHIHQAWGGFENISRVGYNVVLPDGTVLVPDQMISNEVQACYPEIALLGADSVVVVWQESYQFWFQVRDGDGNIVTPTTLLPVPPASRVRYDVACDSLKRIHVVCAQIESTYNEFVLYTVHDIDGTVLFADTIPDDSYYDPFIYIDGNRVHIKYESDNPWRTMYVQYDLDGNITVGPLMLFDDDLMTGHFASIQTDVVGDPYILIIKAPESQSALYALYKLDRNTGSILINGITIGQGVSGCSIDNYIPVFQKMPGEASFYAAWLRGYLYLDFCIIDQNGDFIEEPYVAYDYSDEEIQQIQFLRGAANEEGDLFMTWSEGDTLVWGYYIVLGCLDNDWVNIDDETSTEIQTISALCPSENPFTVSVQLSSPGLAHGGDIEIFNLFGRRIRTLTSSDGLFLWDGLSSSGEPVPSGTYFAVLRNEDFDAVLKLIKLE